MVILHHLRVGRSIFCIWQLEELGIDYELKIYQRNPDTFRAPPELRQVHPLGKSPVVEDGDIQLSESSAITTYLLEKYDTQHRFWPERKNIKEWARFTQWLHYPEGSVFIPLIMRMLLLRSGEPHVAITPFSEGELKLHFDYIRNQLGSNEFILGDKFSAADFGISYMISMAERLQALEPYPELAEYLQRNRSRDAWKRAVERAVE
ncbi:MAG: glutathione S-transferase [Gammaproteobacteria bacterium]|nr:glutathione S-transferase [Gammaproteobacteria bacterium]